MEAEGHKSHNEKDDENAQHSQHGEHELGVTDLDYTIK